MHACASGTALVGSGRNSTYWGGKTTLGGRNMQQILTSVFIYGLKKYKRGKNPPWIILPICCSFLKPRENVSCLHTAQSVSKRWPHFGEACTRGYVLDNIFQIVPPPPNARHIMNRHIRHIRHIRVTEHGLRPARGRQPASAVV